MIDLLGLEAGRTLLDVACGSGGPMLRIVEKTGAHATGIDIHQDGIATAEKQAETRGLAGRATFRVCDASEPLPFDDASFDAVMCIDAINHLPDRERVIADWARVLEPGGRVLFADPIVLTGALTNEEIAIRSSIGFFLFVAPDYDDRVIAASGLELIAKEDTTESVARLAARWREARAKREADLRKVEGDEKFDGLQRFLEVASRIARERRLSRFVYVAEKSARA
jgi:2-polyprenyl-3-methyl-5-hydroxy-6-metoxy-1,4-benzoquinol methylase